MNPKSETAQDPDSSEFIRARRKADEVMHLKCMVSTVQVCGAVRWTGIAAIG